MDGDQNREYEGIHEEKPSLAMKNAISAAVGHCTIMMIMMMNIIIIIIVINIEVSIVMYFSTFSVSNIFTSDPLVANTTDNRTFSF